MPLPIPKYPMTDFHEINLDYLLNKYFEIDTKLASQIAGLKLEVNEHNILLKDADNNVLASIVAPYASEALTAASATRASNADEADVAIKDALGNHIVSYVKSVASDNNVITFYDANGGEIASVGVVTGSNVDVDIYNTDQGNTKALNIILSNMEINDEQEFYSNYTHDQIEALFNAGNSITLMHHLVSTDPELDNLHDYVIPLKFTGAIRFGDFTSNFTTWNEYVIGSSTDNDKIIIKRLR